eukprot:359429-Chlamydomonas_euryale.AAC.4
MLRSAYGAHVHRWDRQLKCLGAPCKNTRLNMYKARMKATYWGKFRAHVQCSRSSPEPSSLCKAWKCYIPSSVNREAAVASPRQCF